jgi:ferredoxin
MPDPNKRLPENVPGRYYVDSQCVDCYVCRDLAPQNFTQKKGRGYLFVYKQPENNEEESLCREAMEACPVEAIGDDGDSIR